MTQELYALGYDRRTEIVRGFLDHFLPNRKPAAYDYPVPEHSDNPKAILNTESGILDYMECHPNEHYALYWEDAGTSWSQAMIFYTRDGNVIFGLAEDEDAMNPIERLRELANFVGAEYSMLGSEQPPPDTTQEFIALCRA